MYAHWPALTQKLISGSIVGPVFLTFCFYYSFTISLVIFYCTSVQFFHFCKKNCAIVTLIEGYLT